MIISVYLGRRYVRLDHKGVVAIGHYTTGGFHVGLEIERRRA